MEFVGDKFIETVEIINTLDEQAVINRRVNLQNRQSQLRQQMVLIKADYDNMTTIIAECDTMLTQFAPMAIPIIEG